MSGKKLRALAYWGKEDITVPGSGVIPSITNDFPEFEKFVPFGGWVGMSVAKGTPPEVVAKIQEAYDYAVGQQKFKDFLAENYYIEVGLQGKKAEEYVALSTSVNAWLLYDLGFGAQEPGRVQYPAPIRTLDLQPCDGEPTGSPNPLFDQEASNHEKKRVGP